MLETAIVFDSAVYQSDHIFNAGGGGLSGIERDMQAAQAANLDANRLAMRQQVHVRFRACPQRKTRPGAQHFKQLQTMPLSRI